MNNCKRLSIVTAPPDHLTRISRELERRQPCAQTTNRAEYTQALIQGRCLSPAPVSVEFAILPDMKAVALVRNEKLPIKDFLEVFQHSTNPEPKEGSMIVGATFAPNDGGRLHRCDQQVAAHHVLILDFDGEMPLIDAMELFERYTGAAYSSASHRVAGVPKFRIVVPLARSITTPQYRALAEWIIEAVGYVIGDDGRPSPRLDAAALRRPSQGYFLPRTMEPDEAWNFTWQGDGAFDPLLIDQVASAVVAKSSKQDERQPRRGDPGVASKYIPLPAVRALERLAVGGFDVVADEKFLLCRLARCPMCSDGEGAPAVSVAGGLSCFRTSCRASAGLSMSEWISEVVPSALQLPRPKSGTACSFRSMEEARRHLEDVLRQAVPADAIRVVVAPPGLGKSFSVAAILREHGEGTYLAPTHDLIEQFKTMLGVPATHLNSAARLCILPSDGRAKVRRISALGFSAALGVCSSCKETVCPAHPRQQIASTSFITLATHAKEMTQHPGKLALPRFIDEAPQLLQREEVTVDELDAWLSLAGDDGWRCPRELQPWLHDRVTLFEALVTVTQGAATTLRNGEIPAALPVLGSFLSLLTTGRRVPSPSASAVRKGYLTAHYPPIDADRILAQIVRGQGVVLHPGKGFTIRDVPDVKHFLGATILDATGDFLAEELRAAYPAAKVEVVQIEVEMDDRAVRREIVRCNTMTMRNLVSNGKLVEGAEGTIANALRQVDPSLGGLGIVTMKPVAEALRAALEGNSYPKLKKVLDRWGADIHVEHYGATRGSNAIEGAGTLIILGDGLANIDATKADAVFLGIDEDRLVESRWAAELVQAEGRARGLFATAEKPVRIVYLGSRCPPGEQWKKVLAGVVVKGVTVTSTSPIKKIPRGRPPGDVHRFLKDAVSKGVRLEELTIGFMKDTARHEVLGLEAPKTFARRTLRRAKQLLLKPNKNL